MLKVSRNHRGADAAPARRDSGEETVTERGDGVFDAASEL
jgi:hypothetical protein